MLLIYSLHDSCCSLNDEEHPFELIKFLVGKINNEFITIGGYWSALDGNDPANDSKTLINTAM